MTTIYLILALLTLKKHQNVSEAVLDKILSKHYTLRYSEEGRPFVHFDSVATPKTQKGVINRNGDYMVSKSDSSVGILEDSTCLYVDSDLKRMSVGPRANLETGLVVPYYDPYEIFAYGINNKMSFQKYIEDGRLTYNFISVGPNEPMINIVLSFYKNQTDSFSIKMVYHQLNRL